MATKKKMVGQEWSQKASGVSRYILFAGVGIMTVFGIALIYFDVMTSYHGWGKVIEDVIDFPEVKSLATVVTVLPTIFQIVWWAAKVAKFEFDNGELFHKEPILLFLFVFLALFDTSLDFAQLYKEGFISGIWAITIAVGAFGLLSELLVTYMGSVFIGMGISIARDVMEVDVSEGHASNFGQAAKVSSGSRPKQSGFPDLT